MALDESTKMKTPELLKLLEVDESADVEFKQEWYKLDSPGQDAQKYIRGELVKDFVSLANGNIDSVGKKGYLIIGASDKPNSSGTRDLLDIPSEVNTSQVQRIVNGKISPPIANIDSVSYEIKNKRLIVLTIGPSPHLHELKTEINSTGRDYDEYSVLIRHNDDVKIASMAEREMLKKLKDVWFNETQNVPPIGYGIAVAGVIGATIGAGLTEPDKRIVAMVIASIMAGFTGGCIGFAYRQWRKFRISVYQVPVKWQSSYLMLSTLFVIAISIVVGVVFRVLGLTR